MFLRFFGRIFLYFYVIPYLDRILRPVLTDMLKDFIRKQYSTMTVDQKERFHRTAPHLMHLITE